MASRVRWAPSLDPLISHYLLQSAPVAAGPFVTIAQVTHSLTDTTVYDISGGHFYYLDAFGSGTTWYRIAAVNLNGVQSAWGTAFTLTQETPSLPGGQDTLRGLRVAVRRRSDTENDPHIQDDELNLWINNSYFELYDILVTRMGDDYFSAKATIPVVGGTEEYTLPDGTLYDGAKAFYKGQLVEALTGPNVIPGIPITLRQFNLREKNYYNIPQMVLTVPYMLPRYRIIGGNIVFAPKPVGPMSIRIWYAPRLNPLSTDCDVADGVSGWLDYIVVDSAIKAMVKQERDPSVLIAQKLGLKERIESVAQTRNQGEPNTVTETHGDGMMGFPGQYPGYGLWY